MLKKSLLILLALSFVFSLSACGKKKTLHCDGCGKEVQVAESSNMEEDWLVFCKECNEDIDFDWNN